MDTDSTQFARLSLLVQRILDAETLLEAEGAALLKESQAAHLALAEGDAQDARSHVEQIARQTAALLEMKALALADGQAVILITNRILTPETDAGE
ncbi:MAG TPA: hypothetical protein VFB21_16200 [Chthonomonadaceae bacterium]|nr:hypothetical protein [Chthonomonadaceae bacterium]